ncbi:MAG: NADH-ubiquinone oxidoreductase-F iron-sulfur binding region domain-containing protein [Acidimicrobiia bacterium]
MSATDHYRVLAGLGDRESVSLADHRTRFPVPPKPSTAADSGLIDAVEQSGLRGRGGAGFPTGRKMRTVASGKGQPVVVANVSEGEPASAKDKTIAVRLPHLLLDGTIHAMRAVGAGEAIVVLERGARRSIASVEEAIEARVQAAEQMPPVKVHLVPDRFVAGEESAIVNHLNTGLAKPYTTPPRVFEKGVAGQPTLVDNAETLAHIALIATQGPNWFREVGIADSPGTMLLTLSGAIARSQVTEVPTGTSLASVIEAAEPIDGVQAVLLGGYYGSWLRGDVAAHVTLDNDDLRPHHASVGCGALVVLPRAACGLRESARVMSWMAAESAGQCGPCVNGIQAMADALAHLAIGRGTADTVSKLHRWAAMVDGRGACRFPDGAVKFLRSTLDVFAGEIDRHLTGQSCQESERVLAIPDVSGKGWK